MRNAEWGAKPSIALRHSAFHIPHSSLFFNFNVENRRVVVFAERLVGVVLSGLAVVLEEEECNLLEGDGLSILAVSLDVGFGETFQTHHLQHHGEVEVHIEEFLFPLDADDSGGVEFKVFDFDFFHFMESFLMCLFYKNTEKKLIFEEFA